MTSIEDINFTVRTYRRLKSAGITTLEAVVNSKDEDLMAIPGFGAGCLSELRESIATSAWKQELRADIKYEIKQLSNDFPKLRGRILSLEKQLSRLKCELDQKTEDVSSRKKQLEQNIKLIESP